MTSTILNAADLINTITEGTDIMTAVASTETEAPKAKGKKAKAKPEAQAEAPKAEAVEPKIISVDGFALNAEASEEAVAKVEAATHDVAEAIKSIGRKDADLLTAYMALGRFQSSVSKLFASSKVYGAYVKAKVPASESLDPALRSNCKWVYEALHNADHEASDLLKVLGVWTGANDPVSDLKTFKSGNPTVIRRSYKEMKAEQERKAELEAKGIDTEDEEAVAAAEKAEAEAEKAKKEADRALATQAVAWWIDTMSAIKQKKVLHKALTDVVVSAFGSKDKREAALSLIVEDYLTAMESDEDDDKEE